MPITVGELRPPPLLITADCLSDLVGDALILKNTFTAYMTKMYFFRETSQNVCRGLSSTPLVVGLRHTHNFDPKYLGQLYARVVHGDSSVQESLAFNVIDRYRHTG